MQKLWGRKISVAATHAGSVRPDGEVCVLRSGSKESLTWYAVPSEFEQKTHFGDEFWNPQLLFDFEF